MFLRWLLVLIIFAGGVFSSEAREKHALIIANKDYIHGGSLTNPIKDSVVLANSLRSAGFQVRVEENLGYSEMRNVISEFGLEHSETDNVALVYYSGHGAEFNGRNYLIPVDAKLEDARKARQEALTLSDVQNFMYRELSDEERAAGRNAKGLNIIILDACRNNPYPARAKSASRGLGETEGASGTLIWYAAQPGARADDGDGQDLSPFAGSFVEALEQSSGETVEETFKQVASLTLRATDGQQEPWQSGNILGRFSFKPGSGARPTGRLLAKFDPAELDVVKPELVPQPKAFRSVREQFGDWRFGSQGRYFGDTFVSFGGIWQKSQSGMIDYVAIEPVLDKFLYDFAGQQISVKSDEKWHLGAKLRYIWTGEATGGQIQVNVDESYYPFYIDDTRFCVNKSGDNKLKGCSYWKPIYQRHIETDYAPGHVMKLWHIVNRRNNGEEPLATLSLKGSRDAFQFNTKIGKFARNRGNVSVLNQMDYSVNQRQCIHEIEYTLLKISGFFQGSLNFGRPKRGSPEFVYIQTVAPRIKSFFDEGDRECAFAYGLLLSEPQFSGIPGVQPNMERGLDLMLEGIMQMPTKPRVLQFAMRYIDRFWDGLGPYSSSKLLAVLNTYQFETALKGTDSLLDRLNKHVLKLRNHEISQLADGAHEHCSELQKADDDRTVQCFDEWLTMFVAPMPAVTVSLVKKKRNEARKAEKSCETADTAWVYLTESTNIGVLQKFAADYNTCPVAQLARVRIEELQ